LPPYSNSMNYSGYCMPKHPKEYLNQNLQNHSLKIEIVVLNKILN